MIRKTIFWLHLACGVVAGVVIGVMSFTGATLAFEKEIVAFAERDARRVTPPSSDARPLALDELVRRAGAARPELVVTALAVTRDPRAAIALNPAARGGPGGTASLYVNPYTSEVREAQAPRTRAFLRTMNAWHRTLGMSGEHRTLGRALTGASNAAFLCLAVTGLYLWWPRAWRAAIVRLNLRLRGKPRDFNWHNAVGLWTAPVLIVLTATALPLSYRWANDAIYRFTGDAIPPPREAAAGGPSRRPGAATPPSRSIVAGDATPPSRRISAGDATTSSRGIAAASTPPDSASREDARPRSRSGFASRNAVPAASPLSFDGLRATIESAHPRWRELTLRPGSGGQPSTATVKETGSWPRTATTTVTVGASGTIQRREGFADLTAGRRLRTWVRFLHTGEAVGWPGQLLAGLASLGAVLLMYTGLALTWRRCFG